MATETKEVTLRSPNEMMAAAKEMMLKGKEPVTNEDWARVVNFWAANAEPTMAYEATRFLCFLYDVPEAVMSQITEIVKFQLDQRNGR